jgi:hypothetical protein
MWDIGLEGLLFVFAYHRNQRRIVRIYRAESVCVVACLRKLSNLRYHHHHHHNTETTT